ncbi:hypothetical protein AMJ85_06915 [candidate division BRC1 bacterium SM23_51]|nr:MAG: hypothetical protein AMJ85_06915 [candidate division BRC1 bacterium SM23_51]
MAKDLNRETRLEILLDQLEQAHAEVAHYRDARARAMNCGALIMLVLLLLAYTKWVPMAALCLPFVAIYVVAQYGYLTHLMFLGRAYAASLESRINSEAGETLVLAELLESTHFGQVGEPHILGIGSTNLTGICSATTLHYLIICLVMFVAGAVRTNYVFSPESGLRPVGKLADVYFPLLTLWAVINVVYLLWYFMAGQDEKKLTAKISKEYQPKNE